MALVVAVLLTCLDRIDRRDRRVAVWAGVAAAAAVCIAAAVIFDQFVGSFEDSAAEPWIEGILALTAAFVLTWMIFWMRSHARGMTGELQSKMDAVIENGSLAVALMAFVAVAREGFETVLFLIGAQEAGQRLGVDTVIGGLIGLGASVVIAVMIYEIGRAHV